MKTGIKNGKDRGTKGAKIQLQGQTQTQDQTLNRTQTQKKQKTETMEQWNKKKDSKHINDTGTNARRNRRTNR